MAAASQMSGSCQAAMHDARSGVRADTSEPRKDGQTAEL